MKFFYKKMVLLVIFCSINLHAAAVRLAIDFDTYVTFYLSDRTEVKVFVQKNKGGLLDSFVYDAYFKNGSNVGIDKIQWAGLDGQRYETILDLKPGDGFVALHIKENNTMTDQDPFAAFGPYFNKIVRKVSP